MVRSCWICKTSGNKLNKSYFRIPKILSHRNPEISDLSALRMEKWRNVLQLPDDPSGIRICSDHFLSGNPGKLLDVNDPDWVPTKNLKRMTSASVETTNKKHTILSRIEKMRNNQMTQSDEIYCRLCLKLVKKELCINIFDNNNEHIVKMITTILGHKITFEQGISSYACSSCLKKVRVCINLLSYFRGNEKCLRDSKSFARNTRAQCEDYDKTRPRRKIQEINNVNECISTDTEQEKDKSSKTEKLYGFQNFGISGLYDSEQIRSIIESNSVSSDEDFPKVTKQVKRERRKYDFQSVNVRPVELKTLKCNNCFKKFNDLEGLKMHKNFCKLFYCQLCKPQAIFRDKDEREEHKKKYHGHSLICHICGKNYSQSYLVKHFKNHFEDRKKCPFCSKTLKNITILMNHVDNFHESRFSSLCEICGGNFKNLKKHLILCRKYES